MKKLMKSVLMLMVVVGLGLVGWGGTSQGSTLSPDSGFDTGSTGLYCYWDYVWYCNPYTGICGYVYRYVCF